ncbi:hypothetical protein SAY87_028975 [Trapa incisa]|uniref:Uncharacterized protein n=1 Tax=Trapa incisa TaxID=236973 RepID=A0AAN7QQL5_9MYRT|nr:hypothetical protein SAY87_028975 [Trapa incisa]
MYNTAEINALEPSPLEGFRNWAYMGRINPIISPKTALSRSQPLIVCYPVSRFCSTGRYQTVNSQSCNSRRYGCSSRIFRFWIGQKSPAELLICEGSSLISMEHMGCINPLSNYNFINGIN